MLCFYFCGVFICGVFCVCGVPVCGVFLRVVCFFYLRCVLFLCCDLCCESLFVL